MNRFYLFILLLFFSVTINAQQSGINENMPGSMFSIKGNFSVGNDTAYSRYNAPQGGAIIQGSVGIGTNNPDTSAILDLSSSSKGLLIPRLTSTQRNAIPSPASGLLVYDTDSSKLFLFSNSWQPMEIGTTQSRRDITYHSINNSTYKAPNSTAETIWLSAPGGDNTDDCWNCTIDFKRGWTAPYNGRLVKVIIRIRNNGGSDPDIQGVVRLKVNSTDFTDNTQFSLNDFGVTTITLPAMGFSFNEGDLIALGLHKRDNSSDRFEDIDIFVTAEWEFP